MTSSTTSQPDIDWIPSYKTYRDQVARLSKITLSRPKSVPEGWPTQVKARIWTGSDFADTEKYLFRLSEGDVTEIENALAHFHSMSRRHSIPVW